MRGTMVAPKEESNGCPLMENQVEGWGVIIFPGSGSKEPHIGVRRPTWVMVVGYKRNLQLT